jgi:hypothetical protein
MALCFLGLQGGDRQAQVPADDLGDVAERDALVADRVQPGARGAVSRASRNRWPLRTSWRPSPSSMVHLCAEA